MTPLRVSVNDSRWRARLRKLAGKVKAKAFEPELRAFAKSTLQTATVLTPARNLSVIRANQAKQYEHRINYIPSYHSEAEPTLIVRNDIHWLHAFGQWYQANIWHLPDHVWSIYQQLLMERDRRMTTRQSSFINARAQARFLYKLSWYIVAQSIGIGLNISGDIRQARSRRKPPKTPPRGSAQLRGGQTTLSIMISNPFLEMPSEYKLFTGRAILRDSASRHAPSFFAALDAKLGAICASV